MTSARPCSLFVYKLVHLTLTTTSEVATVVPSLQFTTLRHREADSLARGHTAARWWSQDTAPVFWPQDLSLLHMAASSHPISARRGGSLSAREQPCSQAASRASTGLVQPESVSSDGSPEPAQGPSWGAEVAPGGLVAFLEQQLSHPICLCVLSSKNKTAASEPTDFIFPRYF